MMLPLLHETLVHHAHPHLDVLTLLAVAGGLLLIGLILARSIRF